MVEAKRGLYCMDCGYFSLRAGGDRCPSCRSENTAEHQGIICPLCHRPTATDDPNYLRCAECEQPLPQVD